MATPPDGSHAAASRRRGLTWLWVLLAAVIVALIAWWLLAGVGDDDEDVEASQPAAAEETEEPPDDETSGSDETEESPSVATAGVILVGDVDLLAEDVDPTTLFGETVEADGAKVQAVVADEAFFVGPGPGRTVLVRLSDFAGEQESPPNVDEGDTVSFTGTVEEVDEALLSQLQLGDAPEVNTGEVYIQAEQLSSQS